MTPQQVLALLALIADQALAIQALTAQAEELNARIAELEPEES